MHPLLDTPVVDLRVTPLSGLLAWVQREPAAQSGAWNAGAVVDCHPVAQDRAGRLGPERPARGQEACGGQRQGAGLLRARRVQAVSQQESRDPSAANKRSSVLPQPCDLKEDPSFRRRHGALMPPRDTEQSS